MEDNGGVRSDDRSSNQASRWEMELVDRAVDREIRRRRVAIRVFWAIVVIVPMALGWWFSESTGTVSERVASVERSAEARILKTQETVESNQRSIDSLMEESDRVRGEIESISATSKDALQRVEEAGKLAVGKFLYEVIVPPYEIGFEHDEIELSPEAEASLDMFIDRFDRAEIDAYLEILGHTDNAGSDSDQRRLGELRAEAVLRYLYIEHDIPLFRMDTFSYGMTQPIADNSDEEGRAMNNRVTLLVRQR